MSGNKKGLTLIELIIALAIFSIVVLLVSDIFLDVIKGQRRSIGIQNIEENLRYTLERMSREIRMSEVKTGEGTFSSLDITAHKPTGDEDVSYKLSSDEITRNDISITSQNTVKITDLKFYVKKNSVQPRVTIVIKAESKDGKQEQISKIHLQTTVVSREY
ncbi:prepilin-type N-terminal cleavage/methylation domain-containing protein [bacterium]|nr:prepilin-type N-terminal cleavage/methylation domain-containing protein [bacterium]